MPAATDPSRPTPSPIKHIHLPATLTPFARGQHLGVSAHPEIHGSLAFYKDFFKRQANLDWPAVCELALARAQPFLEREFAESYVQEMRGVATGAGLQYEDVLALNVRTEIAFGVGVGEREGGGDGCTAFAWMSAGGSWIAQNWDWEVQQRENLVVVHSEGGEGKVGWAMVTEAGILGKIGLNERGVGVTLNAIRLGGVDWGKVPCHLALRSVLDSGSRKEAEERLRRLGVASACHIQIADRETGGVGLECTSKDVVALEQDERGIITHSNHLVADHGMKEKGAMLTDTFFRLDRVRDLLKGMEKPTMEALKEALQDEKNEPCAINRSQTEKSTIQTLFSIVMDLDHAVAEVKMGRPTEDGESFELRP
jgi:isopenicillin-N N-acyltransferase like protein